MPMQTFLLLLRGWTLGYCGRPYGRWITLTCRTCRTDVHNIAVGYKNAIKLLFGFGVACKIDSSVEKNRRKSMWYSWHQVRHVTILPPPEKQDSFSKGASIWLLPSASLKMFSLLTIQCHYLTWQPQSRNILLLYQVWDGRQRGRADKVSLIGS